MLLIICTLTFKLYKVKLHNLYFRLVAVDSPLSQIVINKVGENNVKREEPVRASEPISPDIEGKGLCQEKFTNY